MTKVLKPREKLSISCLFLFLFVQNFPGQAQEKKEVSFPTTHYQLRNGLEVIISEDYTLPLVSVAVAYNVGSVNEQPGKTGLACLLENLMFKGSENVGPMQHISIINKVGGILNATTFEDKTIFCQTVPSNQLTRVLWLESDRMNSLDINFSNIERAKDELLEDLRHQKSSNPYYESSLAFDKLLYPDFAYSHPIIGDEIDLRGLTVEDVKKFYSTFYKPNNAVLVIVGNVDKRKADRDIRKYFETIPKGNDIPSPPPPKTLEKRAVAETFDNLLASSPAFYLGYDVASPSSNDFYPLTIIEYVLLRGKTSHLYRRLVKKELIAISLSGNIEKRKDLARMKIFVINGSALMVEWSQKAIFSEINKLKSGSLSERELERAKNLFRMDYINQFATTMDRALFLADSFLSKKKVVDPGQELEKYLAVTPYQIRRAANRYLTQENIILNVRIK